MGKDKDKEISKLLSHQDLPIWSDAVYRYVGASVLHKLTNLLICGIIDMEVYHWIFCQMGFKVNKTGCFFTVIKERKGIKLLLG